MVRTHAPHTNSLCIYHRCALGGIISTLLANIVLNELDHWVESQWQLNPVTDNYKVRLAENGTQHRGNAYRAMKNTRLKEMRIVRYADDFRIFCHTKTAAEKIKIAVTQWLSERLRLEVSDKKTRVVNVKRQYSEFLGFKIKVHPKGQKQVVKSHMCDKAIRHQREKLVEQAKKIAKPADGRKERDEIALYNSMVMGAQNYYRIATNVSVDCAKLQNAVRLVLYNRLKSQKGNRLCKTGRVLTKAEQERYGKSQQLRYVAGSDEPIYPIGHVKHKNPMDKKRSICSYTPEGRKGLHDNLRINASLMLEVMRQPLYGRSTEYADNRISLFSAQWGKCAVTGREFGCVEDIHCHHKIPKSKDGTDKYDNLILVLAPIHRLIHATDSDTVSKYLKALKLKKSQIAKLNELRQAAGLTMIA